MAGSSTTPDGPGKGPRIVGRYAVFDEIASGGMASVHLGRLVGPVGFSRTVAIKRLHANFAKDPEFVSMFLDEARLASRIQHPNVVSTLDIVTVHDEVFLVMEYVHGESLSRLLAAAREAGTRMPVGHVAAAMSGVLHGLHAAHEAKTERREPLDIVHRDVSPQNVLIGTDGVARVLDFGVAKAALRSYSTRENEMKGKLPYMSPEQLNGHEVDRRTDVFAAGVLLWEALSGRRLFQGNDAGEVFGKVLAHDIPEPKSIVDDISDDLNAVVMRALRRDVDARYQTARDFAVDLEKAASLATAHTVGTWVERIGGEALSARARLVSEIESRSTELEAESLSDAYAGGDGDAEDPEPSFSGPRPRRSRDSEAEDRVSSLAPGPSVITGSQAPVAVSPMARLVLLASLACIAGGALAYAVFSGSKAESHSSAHPTGLSSLKPLDERGATGQEQGPTLSLDDLPRLAGSDGGPSGAKGAKVPIPPTPPARATQKPRAPAGDRCNPPWTVDSNGIRRPKPECL